MNVLAQFAVNGVVAGSVYALIALGFALIFTASRVFHFAHGGVYTLSAFAGYTVLVTLKLGLVAGFIAAIVVAAVVGVLINALLYEPMKAGGVSPFVAMISSFGVLIIITHTTAMIWGSNPVVLSRGGQTTVYRFGPVYTTDAQLLIVGCAAALAVALWIFFRHMRLGIAIRAMGNDSELAEVVGMPAKRLRNISFVVGSALVGVSAMLIGLNVGIIDFNMGNEIILMATVAMIIGGLGNVGAAAGGGFVLGMIQNIAIWKIESKWQMALSFAILIVVLLFKPSGLFGEKRPATGL
ncbi:MAG TPA: branched-chain amino acid ABC transporter permease [Steroidobacter sp.]